VSRGARHHNRPQEIKRYPFERVGPFEHRLVLTEIVFANSAERAEEITQAGPNAFHRVAVNFADTISIIITSPLALTGHVAYGRMFPSRLVQMVVGPPFIRVDNRIWPRLCDEKRLQGRTVTVRANLQAKDAACASDKTDNRKAIIVPHAMPAHSVRPAAGPIRRIGVFQALFARILIHLIHFDRGVVEG
jgi:hypothetical protein